MDRCPRAYFNSLRNLAKAGIPIEGYERAIDSALKMALSFRDPEPDAAEILARIALVSDLPIHVPMIC